MTGPLGPLLALFPEIEAERWRQLKKWGHQSHPDGTGHPGDKALAVWHQAWCDAEFSEGRGTWRDVLTEELWEALAETEQSPLRAELLQVAVVALAWIEDIDRRSGDREPRIVNAPLIAASRSLDRELVPA